MVFPCSRILYLFFESLGLDITSVILNHFKMAATYPFCWWFFSMKESDEWLILVCYTFDWKSFTNSNNLSFWIWNMFELDPFDFYIEDILTKLFQLIVYWLSLTLDPCSWEMIQYFILELHHVLYFYYKLQPPKMKMGFLWNRTKNVEPRAPSSLSKMVDI